MEIYIVQDGERRGPFGLEDLRSRVERGELSADTLAWHAGMAGWTPLSSLLSGRISASSPAITISPLGIVGFAIGILAVALLAWSLIQAGNNASAGNGFAAVGQNVMTLLLITIVGICGLVFSIAAVAGRSRNKNLAFTGLFLNGLGILSAVCLGLVALMQNANQHIKTASAHKPIAVQSIRDVAGAIATNAALERVEKPRVHALWYQKNWLDAYKAVGSHKWTWDNDANEFLSGCVADFLDKTNAPSDEQRLTQSLRVLQEGCDDGLVLYVAARSQVELQRSAELLQRAVTNLQQSGYSPAIAFAANVELHAKLSSMRKSNEQRLQNDKLSLSLLRQWLAVAATNKVEMDFMQDMLLTGRAEAFLHRQSFEVARLFEQNSQVDPWRTHFFRGYNLVRAAWKARGSGSAKSVSNVAWRTFKDSLNDARTELTKAWTLNPEDPNAAALMIEVSMGSSDTPRTEMRLWFDRSVAARLDHDAAYTQLLWGLRPRWHGSHEDMLAFGEQCWKTERFDTDVPYYYFIAVKDAGSELDNPDEIFLQPGVYQNLQKMFAGYLDPANAERWTQFYRTQAAIVAFKAGEYADCKAYLEKLNHKLDPRAQARWREDLGEISGKVAVFCSPAAAEAKKAETEYGRYMAKAALSHFESAKKLCVGDPRALEYIENRIAAVQFEQAIASGDWVDFIPPKDLQGWKIERGQWTVTPDGALESPSGARGVMLKSLARVGPNFEIKGQIEFVTSSNANFQGGVVFGYPEMDKNQWMSFRLRSTKRDGEIACFSEGFRVPEEAPKVQLGATNTFRVQSWQGLLSGYVNGRRVLVDYEPPEAATVKSEDALVGFGGYSNQNDSHVRYRNVKIRRLESAPKHPETLADDIASPK